MQRKLFMLMIVLLVGCQNLKTREESDTETEVRTPPVILPPPVTNTPVPPPPDAGLEELPLPTTNKPHKAPQKIGVILGAGGIRSFAHIGVLKSFFEAKIPIHLIGGIEWGALPALLYAQQGRPHDVEWKMMRLEEKEIPSSGFFSKRVEAEKMDKLNEFIKNATSGISAHTTQVAYTCPAYSVSKRRVYFLRQGTGESVLKACMPYPPLFKPFHDYVADAFGVERLAKELKSRGADYIIFVDVLGAGDVVFPQDSQSYYSEFLLWNELQAYYLRPRLEGVNKVIQIKLNTQSIMNFEARREMMLEGQRASRKPIQDLANQYEF